MQDNNIIKQISDINADINLNYRNSKLPKFIKNIIVSSKRKQLRKTIKKMESTTYIPVVLLSNYIEILSYTYPPFGRYEDCFKITPVNEDKGLYAAIFEIKLENDKLLIVSLAPVDENNNQFMITYKLASEGKVIVSFTDESVTSLEIKDLINLTKTDFKSQDEYQYCRDIFCDTVIDNISKYLYDMIERSERINL